MRIYNLYDVEIIKRYKLFLIIAFVALAGVFIIINRFNRDVEALTVFSASYEKFDKAISSFSESLFTSNPADTSVTDDLERRSYSAFADLKTKASEKISSLVKHDADFMSTNLQCQALYS